MSLPKVAVLIGTRPGIIKMAPIIHKLKKTRADSLIIHTGQHYSTSMDGNIMKDVQLNKPDYHIRRPVDCITHAQQTAYMLVGIEEILLKEKPDVLLVCGDANTNVAGALAARKIHIKVAHVEAGLRSFDWRMPEEHNRIIIDHISEYLFAPTSFAKEHLIRDGVIGQIFLVGNTIVEATWNHLEISKQNRNLESMGIDKDAPHILLTLHREENVDEEKILGRILEAIKEISTSTKMNVLFPVHPRTKDRLRKFGANRIIEGVKYIQLLEPLSYLDFLLVLNSATVVLTDSGGVQEESCILNVPCITLRESTERQETIDIGANYLAGTQRATIVQTFHDVFARRLRSIHRLEPWRNPYGDGKASKRIVETCLYGRPEDEFSDVL